MTNKIPLALLASDVHGELDTKYDTDSIVGTASESGGVPTGAIIERGSNANGEYTKYADGTLECWSPDLVMSYNNPARLSINWTFPVAAIDSGSVGSLSFKGLSVASGEQGAAPWVDSIGTTSARISAVDNDGVYASGDTMTGRAYLKGRWY